MSKIGGVSIGLDMQGGEVNRSLSELKRSMREVNAETKRSLDNYKYGKRDGDAYEKTVTNLTKSIEQQSKDVKDLEKQYTEAVNSSGEKSKAAQDLSIEYEKQAGNLDRLERALEDVSKEQKEFLDAQKEAERLAASPWSKLSTGLETAGGKLTDFGGKMERVGGAATKMSAAILGTGLGIATGLFAMTNKATEAADKIAKGADKMGITTDFYQESAYWASQNGISHDSMERAVGRLNQRLGLALDGNEKYAGALEKLGVDLEGVREGTVSTEDAMIQSITALSQMESEHEKAALASELFGTKLSRDLLPALQDGSLTMEEAKEKAEELGIVMSADQLDAAEVFQDSMDDIKRSLGAVGMQIGLDMMPMFQTMLDWVLDNMPRIREFISNAFDKISSVAINLYERWNNLSSGTQRFILIAGGLTLAFGPIILVIGKFVTALGGILTFMAPVAKAIALKGGLLRSLGGAFGAVLKPLRTIMFPLTRFGSLALRLAPRLLGLTNPVGLLITGITLLTTGFITAYRRSDTFRNAIHRIIEPIKEAWNWVRTFSDGIINMFRGDFDTGTDILSGLGLSENAIQNIGSAFDWVHEKIEGFLNFVTTHMPSFDEVVSFAFSSATATISIFSTVIEALLATASRVFSGVGSALGKIGEGDWKGAWEEIKDMFSDIGEIWGEAFEDIDVTLGNFFGDMWHNAKVWALATSIELGLTMWERVNNWTKIKTVEVTATTGKWYYDTTRKFDALGKSMPLLTAVAWDGVKSWFRIKGLEVIGTLIGWYLNVLGWWDNLKTETGIKAETLWAFAKTIFENSTESVGNTVRGWVGSLVVRFNRLRRDGIQALKDLWEKGTGWFGSLKDDGIQLAKDLASDAAEAFNDIPNKLKSALDKAGEWLTNVRSSLTTRAANLGYSIADGVVKALNFFISGINRVAELLGLSNELISRIPLPSAGRNTGPVRGNESIARYSSGTNFHPGGLALVGDKGPGNNPGGSGVMDRSATREIIRLPDRSEWLADGNLLLDLPRGSQVMSNRDTEDELKSRFFGADFAGGIWDNILNMDWIGNIVDNATTPLNRYSNTVERNAQIAQSTHGLLEWAGNIWDYAKDPKSLVEGMLGRLQIGSMSSEMREFVAQSIWGLTDQATEYVKSLFTRSAHADGSYILNRSISHPFGTYNAAAGSLLFGHRHYGIDTRHYYDPLYSPINGTVTNRFWDGMAGNILQITQGNGLHWWFTHLDLIMKSIGDSVKIGDRIATTGNTGAFSTGPHLHTQVMEGGVGNSYAFDPLPILQRGMSSHKDGGYIQSDGLFNLHANEMVIPLDNPTYAQKLIALAGKKLAGKSKQTRELPNVAQSDSNDKLLAATIEQNGILLKMLEKLTGIEAKDLKIGDDDIGQANDRYSARQSSKQSVTTGRMRYV